MDSSFFIWVGQKMAIVITGASIVGGVVMVGVISLAFAALDDWEEKRKARKPKSRDRIARQRIEEMGRRAARAVADNRSPRERAEDERWAQFCEKYGVTK